MLSCPRSSRNLPRYTFYTTLLTDLCHLPEKKKIQSIVYQHFLLPCFERVKTILFQAQQSIENDVLKRQNKVNEKKSTIQKNANGYFSDYCRGKTNQDCLLPSIEGRFKLDKSLCEFQQSTDAWSNQFTKAILQSMWQSMQFIQSHYQLGIPIVVHKLKSQARECSFSNYN